MLEPDPQVFLTKLAAKIHAGEITEDEGRAQWGDYNTARAKQAIVRMKTFRVMTCLARVIE